MSKIDLFWKVLNNLQKKCSVHLHTAYGDDVIKIDGVTFKKIKRLNLLSIQDHIDSGVLINKITVEEERLCRANHISFLSSDGKLLLFARNYKLDLAIQKSRVKTKISRAKGDDEPKPTTLISPYGLEILDVLFRVSDNELEKQKSALSFARYYQLNQPKLSLMMKALKVRSLATLKEKICQLPDSWWKASLRYPMTRKRLKLFFENEKVYRSLIEGSSVSDFNELLGPVEIAKELGFIHDKDFYFWCAEESIEKLKKINKLIPDRSITVPNWHICTYSKGKDAAIVSMLVDRTSGFYLSHIKSNLFRCVWELGFGDERSKDIQITMLRRILNGV